jgi:hypothetical protein
MTDEQFTTVLLDQLRTLIEHEHSFQDQRSTKQTDILNFLYKLNLRLDQLQLNLINRGCIEGKFQSLHLKDPYK